MKEKMQIFHVKYGEKEQISSVLSPRVSLFDSDPISKLNLTIDLLNRKTQLIDLIGIKRFIRKMISWLAMVF
jgi:hypothetical protein